MFYRQRHSKRADSPPQKKRGISVGKFTKPTMKLQGSEKKLSEKGKEIKKKKQEKGNEKKSRGKKEKKKTRKRRKEG